MGCCASTTYKPAPQQHRHSKAAPPPPPEEETVKEVLSETPILKVQDEEKKRGFGPALLKIQEGDDIYVDTKMPLMTREGVSEFSESLRDNVSTLTEKRGDDDDEVRQRFDRSPAKFRNRGTTARKSPARSEPSPNGVRWQKRESGESSGRMLSSPAAARPAEGGAARTGLGRSSLGRKPGNSPGRAWADLPEKTRKVEEKATPPTTKESLENPLVSLECFIFL